MRAVVLSVKISFLFKIIVIIFQISTRSFYIIKACMLRLFDDSGILFLFMQNIIEHYYLHWSSFWKAYKCRYSWTDNSFLFFI